MDSKTTRRFRELLAILPDEVSARANEAYLLFSTNPNHPSLRFKKVHSTKPIYSARISLDYRVVGILNGDLIVWFWIGNHADYERLLANI